ncbi:hypothetical protein PHMEG_0008208 [Phytophthora megakarya]|uniref:Transmembrane protein n=1 Tax=Phytophthora megakarya TaxID=4795 RepID=A0A225WL09_9STRA|nr:hypothetical protein PHMEG_0008208 [Phytophthora megakarya]
MKVEPSNTQPHNERFSRIDRVRRKLVAYWHRSQIGHRSEYSVERLLAFRDYYERTSIARVVAVCVLTPIPALLAALAIDCIPLKPPSDGWQANYAVWIRLFLAMSAEALGVVFQVRAVIDPGTISIPGAVQISLGTAICSVLTTILLAVVWTFPTPFGYVLVINPCMQCFDDYSMWTFPTPFGYVLVINPFVFFFSVFTVLVIGPRMLIQSATLRKQFKSQFIIILNQGVVAVCYPIFSAVFNQLSGIQQTIFVFVMPLIKFFTKQNIANAAKTYHEYAGPVVVFSVDLFNVYYVAICMQASKSIVTTLIIMAADTFHVIVALRAIFHHESDVQKDSTEGIQHYLRDLPVLLRKLNLEVETQRTGKRSIRLFAPFPLSLSSKSGDFMNELAQTRRFANDKATNRRCSTRRANKRNSGNGAVNSKVSMPTIAALHQNQVVPMSPIICEGPTTNSRKLSKVSVPPDESAVHEGLEALFHSEYILMAEYIEFIVPMLYALYLVVLFNLPVAAYYPHTASMTVRKLHDTVTNILIYAAIEFAAFGALLVILKRKFGFLPLYQLAFVLETQAPALQGHLFVWTITILHLTLVHYGRQCVWFVVVASCLISCSAVTGVDLNILRVFQ